MGPIGYPEMVFIFILALLLFGPKKLPELGKMLGKGLTEFNRAKNELKSTFDREMRDLERETQSIKEVTDSHYHDNYSYDYSSYDPGHELSGAHDAPVETPALEPSTLSASATQGAESTHATAEPAALEGTIANGTYPHYDAAHHDAPHEEPGQHGETAEHAGVKS